MENANYTTTPEMLALAVRCNENGPMVHNSALAEPEPGFELLIEAARWGRHSVLKAAPDIDLSLVWQDWLDRPQNLLGAALAGYAALRKLDLMNPRLQADFVEAVGVVVDSTGGGLALWPEPLPEVVPLVDQVLDRFGFSVVVVAGWH